VHKLSRILMTLLVAVGIASVATPADAAVWKVISGDGTEVTSECLGSNETIECLVDTAIACSVWSQGIMVTVDRKHYRDSTCDSPGLLGNHDYLLLNTPKRLTRYLYLTEQWVLTVEDIPPHFADYGLRSWKGGDTVVDVHAIRCTESYQCSKNTGQPFDPEFGAGCPITSCSGYPKRPDTYDGLHYDVPSVSFIIRKEAPGWRIVDEYEIGRASCRERV